MSGSAPPALLATGKGAQASPVASPLHDLSSQTIFIRVIGRQLVVRLATVSCLLCLVGLDALTSSVSAGKRQLRRRVGHLSGSNLLISPTEMVVRLLLLPVLVEVVSVASRLVSPTKPIAPLPPSFFRPETSLKLSIPETRWPSCCSSGSLPLAAPLVCTRYPI